MGIKALAYIVVAARRDEAWVLANGIVVSPCLGYREAGIGDEWKPIERFPAADDADQIGTSVNRSTIIVGGASLGTAIRDRHAAESHMADWDDALVKACAKYPNMRVFDWASVVNDSWFISDGIHFTTPGYAARSQLIADALAKAFPAAGAAPSSCVVR